VIVTCPACETRYLVDEAELSGPAGRRVRCASCGNLWHYSAEAAAIHQAVAAITAELAAAQADARATATGIASTAPPAPALRPEPGNQAPPLSVAASVARPSVVRPPVARPPVTLPPAVAVRRSPGGGAWLLAVALVASVATILILGRDTLTRLYPPITALYQRLHLAVPSSSGLRITANVTRQGDTLTVNGDIVNDSQEPRPLSRLRVTLRDGRRHAVETRLIAPPIARLPPGLTVYYSTTFERPSITVAGAEVGFAGE
jgi:predicted Zn finger-like uncharacterized protein